MKKYSEQTLVDFQIYMGRLSIQLLEVSNGLGFGLGFFSVGVLFGFFFSV